MSIMSTTTKQSLPPPRKKKTDDDMPISRPKTNASETEMRRRTGAAKSWESQDALVEDPHHVASTCSIFMRGCLCGEDARRRGE